jgi:hypothetical protein
MNRCLTAIVMGLAACPALAADDNGAWNAGLAASFGEYSFDSDQLDDSSAGFKLFAGYRLNEWLGFEGAFHDFGDFEEDLDPPNPGGSCMRRSGVTASRRTARPAITSLIRKW